MNATILFLGTALAVGDGPIVVGGGCSGCGAPTVSYPACGPVVCHPMPACDPCERVGLLDRLKARFAAWRKPKAECAPACTPAPACCTPAPCAVAPTPTCGAPVFTGFTTSCADPCQKAGLLDRLRAKFKSSGSCDAGAAPLPCGSLANSGCGCGR